MGTYSKEAIATGMQSMLDAEKEEKNIRKILEIVTDPKEFDKIWDKVSPASKLIFIQNSLKYSVKEKGRETEADTNTTNVKLDDLDKKLQALNKLLNT